MRIARTALALGVAAVIAASTVGIAVGADAASSSVTYSTTANLNVRSGPSTAKSILAVLPKGTTVAAAGAVANDWLPITYNGKTAYVCADYIKAATTTAPPATGPTQTAVTTQNVNLRSSASLTAAIVTVVMKGTTLTVTGVTSNGFTQVVVSGATNWVYTQYLTAGSTLATTPTKPAPAPTPAPSTPKTVLATATTTSALQQRASASYTATLLATVPTKATISLTGKSSGSYSQAVYKSKTGWVLTGYFTVTSAGTTGMTASKLPVAKKLVYVNDTNVNLRSGASTTSSVITTLAKGTPLAATGSTSGSFTAVIWDAQVRWISSSYVNSTAVALSAGGDLGSVTLNKLQPYGKAAVLEVRQQFPQIKTIYGWRASDTYSSDHPAGRAIDLMLPNYKSNKALGDQIAAYFIANATRLHVKYLCWQQRYYAISAGKWTPMPDRGSDTQNHMDHVHVSFYDSSATL